MSDRSSQRNGRPPLGSPRSSPGSSPQSSPPTTPHTETTKCSWVLARYHSAPTTPRSSHVSQENVSRTAEAEVKQNPDHSSLYLHRSPPTSPHTRMATAGPSWAFAQHRSAPTTPRHVSQESLLIETQRHRGTHTGRPISGSISESEYSYADSDVSPPTRNISFIAWNAIADEYLTKADTLLQKTENFSPSKEVRQALQNAHQTLLDYRQNDSENEAILIAHTKALMDRKRLINRLLIRKDQVRYSSHVIQ